jgi:hypothetical protein
MNQEILEEISPKRKMVSMIKIGGIRALISTNGIIDLERKTNKLLKQKIEDSINDGLENIPENWTVEGEYQDGMFYVYYIKDEDKILDIDDTIAWSKIMGYSMAPLKERNLFENIKNISSEELRPENSFKKCEYSNSIKEFCINGKHRKINWRKRVLEKISEHKI